MTGPGRRVEEPETHFHQSLGFSRRVGNEGPYQMVKCHVDAAENSLTLAGPVKLVEEQKDLETCVRVNQFSRRIRH